MKVSNIFTFLALFLAATVTQAATLNIDWDKPTHRTDNTILQQSEIQHYRVEYGATSGGYTSSFNVDGNNTSTSIEGLPGGIYFVIVTVVDTLGAESVVSTEASITLPTAPPKPVTNLRLTVGAL